MIVSTSVTDNGVLFFFFKLFISWSACATRNVLNPAPALSAQRKLAPVVFHGPGPFPSPLLIKRRFCSSAMFRINSTNASGRSARIWFSSTRTCVVSAWPTIAVCARKVGPKVSRIRVERQVQNLIGLVQAFAGYFFELWGEFVCCDGRFVCTPVGPPTCVYSAFLGGD